MGKPRTRWFSQVEKKQPQWFGNVKMMGRTRHPEGNLN
jgi:hypothetical protein